MVHQRRIMVSQRIFCAGPQAMFKHFASTYGAKLPLLLYYTNRAKDKLLHITRKANWHIYFVALIKRYKNYLSLKNKHMATKKDTAGKTAPTSQAAQDLMELFEDGLKDIYWAEKALTKALPKMAKNASSEELVSALTDHLEVTKNQVTRLEQVFELIGKKAQAKKCDAMEGLIKEGEGIIEETEIGAVRDAGIIAAGQKIEHYEIATYGTLRTWATALGEEEAAAILEETLAEEKEADVTLTTVAEGAVNSEALEDEQDEEEDEEDEDDDEETSGSASGSKSGVAAKKSAAPAKKTSGGGKGSNGQSSGSKSSNGQASGSKGSNGQASGSKSSAGKSSGKSKK